MRIGRKKNWLILVTFLLIVVIGAGYLLVFQPDLNRSNEVLDSQSRVTPATVPFSDSEQAGLTGSGAVESSPTPTGFSPSPEPIPEPLAVRRVLYDVPFTAQAPLGEWDDPLQQDGCEEASALMAVSWARGETIGIPQEARDKILIISRWEQGHYPTAQDTSAVDTVKRIYQGYFGYQAVRAERIEDPEAIIQELMAGNLVVTPMDGRKLGNPYYTQPGPERHMLVIRGYDPQAKTFITNDPGTRRGEAYPYDQEIFWQAIRDYPTGDHEPIVGVEKVMIVVEK